MVARSRRARTASRSRPANTRDGHALLLINPHTSFFFRSELQMTSDEGLDAYGAATWGQFFIYQGFNRHIGWMHTSTGADNVDQFAETIVKRRQPALLPLRPASCGRCTSKTSSCAIATDGGRAGRERASPTYAHPPRPDHPRRTDGKWISDRADE